jgi:hypothetical protein
MELTNVRNVKIEQPNEGALISSVSFECDYTDEFFQEKKSAFVEVPRALINLDYDGKDHFCFNVNALVNSSEDSSGGDFYAKIIMFPENKKYEQKEFVLKAGSIVKLEGLPFVLKEDTVFLGDKENFKLYEQELEKDAIMERTLNRIKLKSFGI